MCPRVAFASVLPLKRGLNPQPLSLPAGSRHHQTSLCPPTSFLGDLWPRSLCWPWLARLLENQGSERLQPFPSSCLWQTKLVRCVLWLEFSAPPEGGREGGRGQWRPKPSQSPSPQAHPVPPTGQGPGGAGKVPVTSPSSSETQRDTAEVNGLTATSDCHPSSPGGPGRGRRVCAGLRGGSQGLPEDAETRCYVSSGSGGGAWTSWRNSWRRFRAQGQAEPCLGALPVDLSGPRSWEAVLTGAWLRKELPEDWVGAGLGRGGCSDCAWDQFRCEPLGQSARIEYQNATLPKPTFWALNVKTQKMPWSPHLLFLSGPQVCGCPGPAETGTQDCPTPAASALFSLRPFVPHT